MIFTCYRTPPTGTLRIWTICHGVLMLLHYCSTLTIQFSCSVCLPIAVLYPFICHALSVLFTCCSTLPTQLVCCVSVVYLLQYPTYPVAVLCQCCLPVAVPYLSSCCAVAVLFTCCSNLPIHLPCCVSVV